MSVSTVLALIFAYGTGAFGYLWLDVRSQNKVLTRALEMAGPQRDSKGRFQKKAN